MVAETKQSITYAPVPPDKAEIIGQLSPGTNAKEGLVGAVGLNVAIVSEILTEQMDLPPYIRLGGVVLVGGASWGLLMKSLVGNPIKMHKQRRAIQAAVASEEARFFPGAHLGVNLSEKILETDVAFISENGLASRTAGSLLESVGEYAPGIRIQGREKGRIVGSVSPKGLVKHSLEQLDKSERSHFLRDAEMELYRVSQDAQRLRPPGLTPQTPDSMRPAVAGPASDLLIGALGAYGVLRGRVGPMVGQRLEDFYATQPDDHPEIITDITRLNTPTADNTPWATIQAYREQLV